MNNAIILCAGYGKRLKSDYPKCLYPLFRKPIVEYIYDTLNKLSQINNIYTIIGYKHELFYKYENEKNKLIKQTKINGLAGACIKAKKYILKDDDYTIIIPGDKPLITKDILNKLINAHINNNNDITLIKTFNNKNKKYGRILLDKSNNIKKIISYNELKKINSNKKLYLNTSIYIIKNRYYNFLFNKIKKHDKELLLSDIINVAYKNNLKIGSIYVKEYQKFYGINNFYDLAKIENYIKSKINRFHMKNGINLINPKTIIISADVKIKKGTIIYPNTYITGNTIINKNVIIGPNTEIHNSIIGNKTIIKHSLIYDSIIKDNCTIGPFANLRMNTIINNNIKIGNFVEIKNSTIDDFTKASHLTYIGDATIGKNVNLGCGSITVNYDGLNKYKTIIKDNCFIGCNTNLIAPLIINENAFIGAGSTITNNVPKDAFSIARSYQINKEGYALKYPYAKKFINNN